MAYDYLSAKKITEPAEMQTPNTVNTEVQESVQANRVVAPIEPQNYATSMKPRQETTQQPVQTTQPQDATQNVAQQNVMSQVQAVQPVQNQSNVAVQIPSDLYDQTVQGYLDEYKKGQEINDYQAQINALNAIDQYRTTQGYKPIYTSNIYDLTNQRVQKIKNQIREYETDIAEAINAGNEALAQQIGQQMEAYKKAVNYGETVDNSATYLQNIEYKSTYDSVISGIVNELLTTRFTYDPSDDEALLKAQQYATNSVYESMNAKGILDSTMTAQIVTKTVNELIPVYENMAKEEFYNNLERLQSMANFVMNLEETQYSRWVDQVQLKLDYYEAQKDEIAYQWDRVNQLGYVDNEASIILGVAPGTMSPSMREAIEEAERTANEQYNKLYSDIALAEAKAEIEAQLYATKKSIDAQYKTTSTNKGNTLGNGVSEIYGSDWSYEEKKADILAKFEVGEIDEAGAIEAIYANFEPNEIPKALWAIVGMTEKQAQDTYKNGTATNLMDKLAETYGDLTEDNRAYYESEIVALADEEYIDESMVDILDQQIKNGLEYNKLYATYEQVLNNQIKDATKFGKEALKQRNFERQSDVLEKYSTGKNGIIAKYGTEKYQTLKNMIEQKEQELSAILDEKGIDW